MSDIGELLCSRDAECFASSLNAVCSQRSGNCTCNPWYGWEGPGCRDIVAPGPLFLIVTWALVMALSIFGVFFGIYDFRRAQKSFQENFKSSKKRINAAMSTTINAIVALILLGLWGGFSIASVVAGAGPDGWGSATLTKVSTLGMFELVTMFIAPLSMVACSLSLMRTSLLWIEIASRSRSMRPVTGASFRRTSRLLILVHGLLLGVVAASWGLAFGFNSSDARFSLRLIFSVASIPISLLVLVSFFVGASNLKAVLIQARKTVYGNTTNDDRTSNDASATGGVVMGRRSTVLAAIKRLSRSSNDSPPEVQQPPNAHRSVSLDNNDVNAAIRRVSDGTLAVAAGGGGNEVTVRMKSGVSELPVPHVFTQGGSAMRASRWNHHARLVHRTNVQVCVIVVLGLASMIAFVVLEVIFGWRDAPRVAGRVSVEVIVWMVGPLCLAVSQLLILQYVNVASSRIKTSSNGAANTGSLPGSKRNHTFLFPPRRKSSATTRKDRQHSLVLLDQAATSNPAFMAAEPAQYLKKTLSHIREEPHLTSTHSQHMFQPEMSSPKATSSKSESPGSQNAGAELGAAEHSHGTGEQQQRSRGGNNPQRAGGGSFSSFGSFIAEKSDETESADSIVVMLDDLPPPPPLNSRSSSFSSSS